MKRLPDLRKGPGVRSSLGLLPLFLVVLDDFFCLGWFWLEMVGVFLI